MGRHLELRPLTRGEQRVLRSKLRDLTLSVRIHQRYRVIDQVQRGFRLPEAAERVGCHFTVAYDWVHRISKAFCYLRQSYPRKRLFVISGQPAAASTIIPASSPCYDDSTFDLSGRRQKLLGST